MKKVYFLISTIALMIFLSCGDDGNPVNSNNSNPEGSLYVLNQGDNTLYIYDTKTMTRTDSIDTKVAMPHYIEFSPDKQHYYITTLEVLGHLAKFDAATNMFIDSITIPFQPTAIAITADSRYGYICNFSSANTSTRTRIYKYDLLNMTLVDSMQAGAVTHDVKITSDGSVVIATNRYSDNLTLIYPDADTVRNISVDPDVEYPTPSNTYGPFGVIIDNNDSLAYIACDDASQIRVFDIKNRVVIDSVAVPDTSSISTISGPTLLAISPDNSHIFVTTRLNNIIAVIQTSPLQLVTTIPHETPASFGIDISDDGSRVYVACINSSSNRGRVYIIDGNSFEKIDSIDVGNQLFGLRWQPKR